MTCKAAYGIVLTLLLVGTLTFAFNIQPVEVSGTSYIQADGDEYFASVEVNPFDDDGDGYDDSAEVVMNVDTTNGAVVVSVDIEFWFYDSGSTPDVVHKSWEIVGTEVEYVREVHSLYFQVEGWYEVRLHLWDEDSNLEDTYSTIVWLYPWGIGVGSVEYFDYVNFSQFDSSGDGYDDAVEVTIDVDTTVDARRFVLCQGIIIYVDPITGVSHIAPDYLVYDVFVINGTRDDDALVATFVVQEGWSPRWYYIEVLLLGIEVILGEDQVEEDWAYHDHFLYSPDYVPVPDFEISASPTSSQTVSPEEAASYTITVTSVAGFDSPVQLSGSIEPITNAITLTFDPETITPPSDGSIQSTLTVSTTSTVIPQTYVITTTGTSGEITDSTDVTLTISDIATATTLNIHTVDEGDIDLFATIYLDNEWKGSGFFVSLKSIVPGKHKVRAERLGYEPSEMEFSLSAGENKDITLKLFEWTAAVVSKRFVRKIISGPSTFSVDITLLNPSVSELRNVELFPWGDITDWTAFSENGFNVPSVGEKRITVTFSVPRYSDFITGKIEVLTANGGNIYINVIIISPQLEQKIEGIAEKNEKPDESHFAYYFKYKGHPMVMIVYFKTLARTDWTSATLFNVTSNTYVTNKEMIENLLIYQLAVCEMSLLGEDILAPSRLYNIGGVPSPTVKKSEFYDMLAEDYIGDVNRLYSSFKNVHTCLAIVSVLQSFLGDPTGVITQSSIVFELATLDPEIEDSFPYYEMLSQMLKASGILSKLRNVLDKLDYLSKLYDDTKKAYDAIKAGKKLSEALSLVSLVNIVKSLNLFVNLASFGDWALLETSHAKAGLAYATLAEHATALANNYFLLENGLGDEMTVKMVFAETCIIRSLNKEIYETYKEVLERNKYNLLFWIGIELAKWVKGGELPDFDSLIEEEEQALSNLDRIYTNIVETALRLTKNYRIPQQTKNFEFNAPIGTFDIFVIANSTISSLTFDSVRQQIDITVDGPSGTVGFCNVIVPKQLAENSFKVYVDGSEWTYTISENATAYFVFLTYSHSQHIISVSFSFKQIQPPISIWWIALVAIATASILASFVLIRKRKGLSSKFKVEIKNGF